MNGKTGNWEDELWLCISAGDGMKCPFSGSCQLEKKINGCFNSLRQRQDTHKTHILIDDDNINITNNNTTIMPRISRCAVQRKIFALVKKLAEKYRTENWDNSLPVPDDLILNATDELPIEIRYVPLKAIHGSVWRLNDSWLIHLNSNDTLARQRFTLYHEIFHILAHCKSSPVFKQTRDSEVYFNEILADKFSANILMPHESLVAKWAASKDVNKLANAFNVPRPLIYLSLRYKRLI